MFLHIIKYKFKCLMRDKTILFWALMLPIILITLFNFTYKNILSPDEFSQVEIAVVDSSSFHENEGFKSFINSLIISYENNIQSTIQVVLMSSEEAIKLLNDKKIDGYIEVGEEINLIVNQSGANQSIIKAVMDEYVQNYSMIQRIAKDNPSVLNENIIYDKDYVQDIPVGKGNVDSSVIIYYSLLAMSCMYSSFWGLRIIIESQANLSMLGARLSLIPLKKLKVLAIDFLAACFVQFVIINFQLLFLVYVLKVDLGNQIAHIIIAITVGSLMGISLGAFIGSIVRKGEDTQVSIVNAVIAIGYILTISAEVKYFITSRFPILAYINPLNLINDALYSLYFFDGYTRYLSNILIMIILTFIFSMVTYLSVRRIRYANI